MKCDLYPKKILRQKVFETPISLLGVLNDGPIALEFSPEEPSASSGDTNSPTTTTTTIRKDFPESWLWEEYNTESKLKGFVFRFRQIYAIVKILKAYTDARRIFGDGNNNFNTTNNNNQKCVQYTYICRLLNSESHS